MGCNICHNLEEEPEKPGRIMVHFKLLTLESSAGHGCPYCSILYQAIVQSGFSSLAWTLESQARAWINNDGESLNLAVQVYTPQGQSQAS
jgi:hypothetical protein